MQTVGETETTDGGNETTRYNNDTTTAAPAANSGNALEGVSDIESAFDDLLA